MLWRAKHRLGTELSPASRMTAFVALYARPEIIRGEQCTGGASRLWLRLSGPWRRHSCQGRFTQGAPCQRFARNCAMRSHASPHDPTLGSAFHLLGCVGR
jgi:hypothetical protein